MTERENMAVLVKFCCTVTKYVNVALQKTEIRYQEDFGDLSAYDWATYFFFKQYRIVTLPVFYF